MINSDTEKQELIKKILEISSMIRVMEDFASKFKINITDDKIYVAAIVHKKTLEEILSNLK
jgi:hypothetical protein